MKIFTLLITAIAMSAASFGQSLPVEWTNSYHPRGKTSDRASLIKADVAGNVVVAGYASGPFGIRDAFAIKYNAAGDTLWTYSYDGPVSDEDEVLDLALDASGNVYLAGYSTGTNYQDECIAIKLDANGSELWVNRYTGPSASDSRGNAIAVDATGNVYVAGYYDGPLSPKDGLVLKYSANGALQWTDLMNTPSGESDEVMDIAIGTLQEAAICGTGTAGGTYDVFVKEYQPGGTTAWVDTFHSGTSGADYAIALSYTLSGEVRVAGDCYLGGVQGHNVLALGYDAAGNRTWSTIYTDTTTANDEIANAMAIDTAGNIFITAYDFVSQNLYRINTDGSQGWKRSWRGPLPNTHDLAFSVATDAAGNVYTTGKGIYPGPNHFGNGGLDLMTVVKYSASGDSLWSWNQGSSTDVSIGFGIAVRDDKVYAAGFKADTAYLNEDLLTMVLDTAGTVLHEWVYNGAGDAVLRGQFVLTDVQDNVYAAGTSTNWVGGTYDVSIVSYDASGNLRWEVDYSTPWLRNDTLTGMAFDPSGDLLLSLSSDTDGTHANYQLALVRISSLGSVLQERTYSGSTGNRFADTILVRNDGSIVLGCQAGTLGASLFCFDASFNPLWTAQLDTLQPSTLFLKGCSLFPAGDLAVVATKDTGGVTSRSMVVQRIAASGQRLWESSMDSLNTRDDAWDIAVDAAGDVAICGGSGAAAVVAKLNGVNGSQQWRTLYNPANSVSEAGIKVRFTPAGNVALLTLGYSGFVYRWFTAQFDGVTGGQQWATGYSNIASDRIPVDLIVLPDSTVATGGFQISGATIPNYDYVVVTYNSAGAQRSLNLFSTPGIYPDRLRALTSDSQGNLVVTGESSNSFLNDYWYRMTTIKFGRSPVGVEEINRVPEGNWTAWPNPSHTGQFVFHGLPEYTLDVEVYNAVGQRIQMTQKVADGFLLNLSSYPPGLYLVRFWHGEKYVGSSKLIRE